jgi:hypothetical protein
MFFVFFISVTVYVMRLDKDYIKKLADYPNNADDDLPGQEDNQI